MERGPVSVLAFAPKFVFGIFCLILFVLSSINWSLLTYINSKCGQVDLPGLSYLVEQVKWIDCRKKVPLGPYRMSSFIYLNINIYSIYKKVLYI